MKTIVTITGHRPEKLQAYAGPNDTVISGVAEAVSNNLLYLETDFMWQGMAAGVDIIAAKKAYELGIPYGAAIPWKTHRARIHWHNDYQLARDHAETVEYATDYDEYPGPWVYEIRNRYMVDRSNLVLAVWDGTEGGTANCVKYAVKKGLPVYILNPKDGLSGTWIR